MDHDKYPTIFHIDIDAFFASVEEALCPALKGKPVVVGGLPNERGVVTCPNYEARKLGVKTAMSLSQAYSIAPGAIFMRGNYKNYEKYSRRFIEILHDFSPVVQPVSLDEAFLDADGCLHFWNYDPRNLAMAIKRAISEEMKITVSIGVASNKLCAKVASDYSKKVSMGTNHGASSTPNGLFVVPIGEEKNFLAPLPVSALPGIGKRTTEALESLGIDTVRKLSNANLDSLQRIFGIVGAYLHDAANGIGAGAKHDSPLNSDDREAKSISRSTTFSEDSGDEEFISSVIFYLSEKVASALRRDKLTASTIVIKLRYSDGAPLLGYRMKSSYANRRFVTYQKNYTLEEPTNSEFEIASTAFALFKSLWLQGIKVRLVGVGVMYIRNECMQLDLFRRSRIKQAYLLAGIDRLREKFGYHSIYFGIIDKMENKYDSDPHGFQLHSPSHSR
ncbi:MAG: DNA polymerase IV [Candidatus Kryptoniota bacterium]